MSPAEHWAWLCRPALIPYQQYLLSSGYTNGPSVHGDGAKIALQSGWRVP